MTGETEDTDVGFPGPEHFIAEREFPMKLAMTALAVLATVAGLIQIPGVDDAIHNFLAPVFANSAVAQTEVSDTRSWVCLIIGATVGLAGIAVAYRLYIKQPDEPGRLRERFARIHHFLTEKWYFDDAIDVVFVRPAAAFGRWALNTFDRVFVNGFLVGGTTGAVRAGSAAVRAVQNGLLRYYAALLIVGLAATTLYFLIKAS
jgi:NADH-quinone oxidoreductase subunit L